MVAYSGHSIERGIAIVPYGMRPDKAFLERSLNELDWPLGRPQALGEGRIRDLRPQDHLVFYPSSGLWLRAFRGLRAQISLMIVEPAAIHARHMRLARIFSRRFACILTCNPDLLRRIPNSGFLALGTSWVKNWQTLDLTKTEHMSLIASNKRDQVGHRLRHDVAAWAQDAQPDVTLMGRAFRPFDEKSEGLAPFRYSVIIENVREPSYFTEKLIDAMLCKTVPIYWGAPDIGSYFNADGLIQCSDLEALRSAISDASEADYATRLEALAENQARAADYIDLHGRAARALVDCLKL